MSQLLYFRHAQASYGKADYDQLSAKGYQQAELLGQHLLEQNIHFDYIYVGPHRRQGQTFTGVRAVYEKAGFTVPDPQEMQELEEHRGPDVLHYLFDLLVKEDEQIRTWEIERIAKPKLNRKNGLLIFNRAMELWATGHLDQHHPPEYLTWPAFRKQVGQGHQVIIDRHQKERGLKIGLFTSGGTISATMGHILGMAHDKDIIRLNGIVQNTSISEFLFSGQRVTLKRFNDVSHLPEEMKTYV